MDKILVHGGRKLSGSINISGSKNSALPILAATLLTKEECVIHHVPDLSDVHYMLQILDHLGAAVERASGTVTVKAEKITTEAPYEVVRKMRASVCVLGPLLGREREATVSMPGGCVIGDRPIDLHLKGFEALGAAVRVVGGDVKVLAPELKGAVIPMTGKFGSTVLGTDNVMMAAVLADGTTVIDGAAEEPEVVDLANFLNKMGAKIEGAGTRRIIIEGVKELHGAEHEVIPDRIEAGTFMVAAAVAGKRSASAVSIPPTSPPSSQALERGGFHIKTDRSLPHRPRQWRAHLPRAHYRALPRLPHRHAGPDVRPPRPWQRHQRHHREHLPPALHARLRAQAHGRGHQPRRPHRHHQGRRDASAAPP